MDDGGRTGDPFDPTAPKTRVDVSVNADLVRLARTHTADLSATVETLLAAWARREQSRADDDPESRRRVVEAWNTFDERHGRFADEWNRDFMPGAVRR